MATVLSRGAGKVNTISANTTLQLGDAGEFHAVSRWIVHYNVTIGTFTIKPQKAGSIIDPELQNAFADCWYTDALANQVQTAGTTQSANGIMDVDAAGCDVQLVVTVAGGGIVTLIANPLLG